VKEKPRRPARRVRHRPLARDRLRVRVLVGMGLARTGTHDPAPYHFRFGVGWSRTGHARAVKPGERLRRGPGPHGCKGDLRTALMSRSNASSRNSIGKSGAALYRVEDSFVKLRRWESPSLRAYGSRSSSMPRADVLLSLGRGPGRAASSLARLWLPVAFPFSLQPCSFSIVARILQRSTRISTE